MDTPLTYDQLTELAYKKITGGLTEAEDNALMNTFESSPDKKSFWYELIDPEAIAEQIVMMNEFDVEASWKKVKARHDFNQKDVAIGFFKLLNVKNIANKVREFLKTKYSTN